VVNNLVVIGANSEFCQIFLDIADESEWKIYGISRKKINTIPSDNQLLVSNYLDDIEKILFFLSKVENAYVVFFNGFLAENRPTYFPSDSEINKTIEVNYLVPYQITLKMIAKLKIKKLIYISSIAATKPRYKNFIYGICKRNLEESISQIDDLDYLIIRYGQIHTSMSKNHSSAPFSLSKEQAARKLFKLINQNGKKYASKPLLISSLLIKFLPIKFINYIEGRN
jgi:hypothetical protein